MPGKPVRSIIEAMFSSRPSAPLDTAPRMQVRRFSGTSLYGSGPDRSSAGCAGGKGRLLPPPVRAGTASPDQIRAVGRSASCIGSLSSRMTSVASIAGRYGFDSTLPSSGADDPVRGKPLNPVV